MNQLKLFTFFPKNFCSFIVWRKNSFEGHLLRFPAFSIFQTRHKTPRLDRLCLFSLFDLISLVRQHRSSLCNLPSLFHSHFIIQSHKIDIFFWHSGSQCLPCSPFIHYLLISRLTLLFFLHEFPLVPRSLFLSFSWLKSNFVFPVALHERAAGTNGYAERKRETKSCNGRS